MTAKEEREMVDSELLRMLEDVANREIPCQVAYRDVQKRLTAARAEGAEQERQKQKVEEEIQHIRAEIKMYDQFLVEISTLDGLPATRMGYESKKKDAEERLASVLAPTKESEK